MNKSFPKQHAHRAGEYGGARLKFVIVMVIFIAVGYAGYLYVPVQFDAWRFKDLMKHECDVAAAQGYKPDWVRDQLVKSAAEYSVPADAVITAQQAENKMTVRVQFIRPIEFPGYTYNYEFDHTAKSTDFLTFK